MDSKEWYDIFIETLYKKYHRKTELIQALMDLLYIEREAVYRRLRQEVLFSVYEIAKISKAWNISLDSIMGTNSHQIPFQMQQMNCLDPSKDEWEQFQCILQNLQSVKDSPDTEYMEICNKLPSQLLAGYEYLNRFCLFKCLYQYGNDNEVVTFSKTVISDEKAYYTAEYVSAIKQAPSSSFIFDRRLFEILVSNIRYFYSIRLITDEEKDLIKKDLFNLLDYLSNVANNGCYPETKKKVSLYISEINIGTNYSYAFSKEVQICYVHVFEKYKIYTMDKEMVTNFRRWMQLKKRSSIKISVVNERSRVEYFAKQRQIAAAL
jgi:hypothetical protein